MPVKTNKTVEKSGRRGPPFRLRFTEVASAELAGMGSNTTLKQRHKAVLTSLGFLEVNPRHPSLKTHKFTSKQGPAGEDVFEAYAQNRTPGAYRIFFYYGPEGDEITILAITPHP